MLTRLKAGRTLEDVLNAASEGADLSDMIHGGSAVLMADPGTTSDGRVMLDLVAGRTYLLVCMAKDNPDAPPNTRLGVRTSFFVAQMHP